jgi:membrane associated rhomboid family serine protease
MIFPIFRGLLPPHLVPVTWFLLAMNLFVFSVNFPAFHSAQMELESYFSDIDFMRTQGSAFSEFVKSKPEHYSFFLREMASRAIDGDQVSQVLMGGYAVRNSRFMEAAAATEFKGDEIALRKWRKSFLELRAIQERHPTYAWGLSALRPTWANWISYQFAHSGFQHLFWNMLILAVFATCLEAEIGGSLVMLIYLFSGLTGAALFFALSGLSFSPLVGASGAISGIMGCLAVYMWGQRVRFFYWLLPAQGYYGFRDLPAWLIIIVYLIPDLAGQISSLGDVNGLAYSAHLGGAALGAIAGLAIRLGWLVKDETPQLTGS